MGFRATMYGSHKSHYPWLKGHENEEEIDNDYVLRNNHRIITTEPISMILVSFFLEDCVLSDEIKICYTSEYQCKKNWAFRFFFWGGGHPVYIYFFLFSISKQLILPFHSYLVSTATSPSSPEAIDDMSLLHGRRTFTRRSLRDKDTGNKLSPDFKGMCWNILSPSRFFVFIVVEVEYYNSVLMSSAGF